MEQYTWNFMDIKVCSEFFWAAFNIAFEMVLIGIQNNIELSFTFHYNKCVCVFECYLQQPEG